MLILYRCCFNNVCIVADRSTHITLEHLLAFVKSCVFSLLCLRSRKRFDHFFQMYRGWTANRTILWQRSISSRYTQDTVQILKLELNWKQIKYSLRLDKCNLQRSKFVRYLCVTTVLVQIGFVIDVLHSDGVPGRQCRVNDWQII